MERAKEAQDQVSVLDTLRALLDTAAGLVGDLARRTDPLPGRLSRVFDRMPAEDREPILQILEREVELRLLGRSKGESIVGLHVERPDPNAKLYVRVWERVPTFEGQEDLLRAVFRGIQLMLHAPVRLREEWEAACVKALRVLDDADRAALVRHLRLWLAVAERPTQDVAAEVR